jgi:hypothetical protein
LKVSFACVFAFVALMLAACPSVWAANASVYVSDTIPTTMVAGVAYTAIVTMKNTGTTTWSDGTGTADYDFGPSDIGSPNPALEWGPRSNVGASVAPGASSPITINVTPTQAGTYICRWRMVQELVEWFGDECTKTITVTGAVSDTIWAMETFDTYGLGTLQANGPPSGTTLGIWNCQESVNTDQITIGEWGVTGNAVQIWHKSGSARTNLTDGSFRTSWHIDEPPYNNKIKVSFSFKRLTNAGDDFWQFVFRDWVGTTTRCYGFVQGSDTCVRAYDTAYADKMGVGSAPQALSDGWHTLSMLVDYQEPTAPNKVYYYLDGAYFFTGTSDGGALNTCRVRSVDLIHMAGSTNEMKVLIDNISLASASLPTNIITSPISSDVFATLTPTITWTRAWNSSDVAATQVRVCSANDPDSALVWQSGDVAGANLSQTTGALPSDTDLWVFERDQLNGGGYQPWSEGVQFRCTVYTLSAPTLTAPTGTVSSGKPRVRFTGAAHTLLRVKVTTDSGGNAVVYDTGNISSTQLQCVVGPLSSGSYYAFAKIGITTGSSNWSAGLPFTIDTAGQVVDIRHMNEPNILTTDRPGPDDGFGHLLNSQYSDVPATTATVSASSPYCDSQSLLWNDRGSARSLRTHKIGTGSDYTKMDLDNGVTFVWAAAVLLEGGADGIGASWRMATNLLMDKDSSGVTHFVAVRTLPSGIGIITDTASGNEAYGTGFRHHWAAWTPTTDYRIIRLTGRNKAPGNYTSTVWTVYVNEDPVPVLTATGCMTGSVMDTDSSTWQTDAIAIGHGSANSVGDIMFDWTAVNGSCDYAPGEWDPLGSVYSTGIGAAKSAGAECRPVTISGPMVITRVATHNEYLSDPAYVISIPDGYYVQDAAGTPGAGGILVLSADTTGIEPGRQVLSLKGIMTRKAEGMAIVDPTVTLGHGAPYAPTDLSMINVGGPCITRGAVTPENTGMLVRVSGWVPTVLFSFDYGPNGAYVVYVDDGSGAVDGYDYIEGQPVPGIRLIIDASDPETLVPFYGDYTVVEGISAYGKGGETGTDEVRRILYPTFVTYTDSTPPGPISSLAASRGDARATLSWTNPADNDFAGTMILRKTTGYPTGPYDGTFVTDQLGVSGATDTHVDTGLTNGVTYYYGAFAYDHSYNYSASTNVSCALPAEASVAQAKILPDGQTRLVKGGAVTAVFTGYFYIQAVDKSAAIRVAWTQQAPALGSKVNILGATGRTSDFEKYLQATSVTLSGTSQITLAAMSDTSSIAPLAVSNKALGGQDFNYDPATGAGQCGVEDGIGLNNIGMLVSITGAVKASGTDFFYIDDGTEARDASIFHGVRVICGGLSKPQVGRQVVVTGISGISRVGGRLFRSITPRYQSDVQLML